MFSRGNSRDRKTLIYSTSMYLKQVKDIFDQTFVDLTYVIIPC